MSRGEEAADADVAIQEEARQRDKWKNDNLHRVGSQKLNCYRDYFHVDGNSCNVSLVF